MNDDWIGRALPYVGFWLGCASAAYGLVVALTTASVWALLPGAAGGALAGICAGWLDW